MDVRPEAVARTRKFEGSKNHFYLDTLANVTVGVGHLLPTAVSTRTIEMLDGKQVATEKEKAKEWQAVKDGEEATLRMLAAEIDRLLTEDLVNSAKDLKKRFPDLDIYPENAQDALLDMIFNIGISKFNDKSWPTLFAAVKKKDWEAAANASNRSQVSDERNAAIKQLFLDSAKFDKYARDASASFLSNYLSVLRTTGEAVARSPQLFPAGLAGFEYESSAGGITNRVRLEGQTIVAGPSEVVGSPTSAKRSSRADTRIRG